MRIIPVLDVRGGVAVHAKGGDRAHYRPVRSILHEGSDPIGLARAYRDRLGLDTVYVADLDAIAGSPPDLGLIRTLSASPLEVWVDAGLRDADHVPPLLDAGASVVIAGLETLRGPAVLAAMLARFGADRVALSLDLRDGRPILDDDSEWSHDPLTIVAAAVGRGISKLIVLDLASVGRAGGVGTLGLIAAIRGVDSSLEIVAGGGVAGPEELRALAEAGISGALVASALHDGRIGRRPN